MFVVYSICLRACKNLCCICGGTEREGIPVKYGRELTHYKLESNISTKQLHVPTTICRGICCLGNIFGPPFCWGACNVLYVYHTI